MLALSIEAEAKAREKYNLFDFVTLFLVEHGADDKTKELVKNYPFPAKYVIREKKFGLTINILEGMKAAFNMTDDFVLHLEDDILLYEDYFKYMHVLMDLCDNKYSVLSGYIREDGENVNEVNKHNHYAAWAPIISKHFFTKYVLPCAHIDYYKNPAAYVIALNSLYKKHWENRKYKYTDSMHYEQAGLINRLVDVAVIEEDLYLYAPKINRQQHIGYFGKNRPGAAIPGSSFEERIENLREIITDANRMYQLSNTKQYNDYLVFSDKLNSWDGTLFLGNYAGTCTDE
jgi:hypothetical protein